MPLFSANMPTMTYPISVEQGRTVDIRSKFQTNSKSNPHLDTNQQSNFGSRLDEMIDLLGQTPVTTLESMSPEIQTLVDSLCGGSEYRVKPQSVVVYLRILIHSAQQFEDISRAVADDSMSALETLEARLKG